MNGKPDALEGACPVWGGEAGKRFDRALPLTPLWTDEGWLYLAVVIDLFSRKVIGWSISERMTKELVCAAQKMAIDNRAELKDTIMHTHRGSQYCSKRFQQQLKTNGLLSSMSDKGNCYDNACAESFFHSLKVEAIHGEMIKHAIRCVLPCLNTSNWITIETVITRRLAIQAQSIMRWYKLLN